MSASIADHQNRKLNFLLWGGVVLAGLVVALIIIMFWLASHQTRDSQAESAKIIERVNRLYEVPTNETPTVAKIQDSSKLDKKQTFYEPAKTGDYVLIYPKSGIAMLYRQSTGKLVNVSPISPASPGQKTTQ